MRFSFRPLLETTLILLVSLLWCEVGYYYYVFLYKCPGWPEPSSIEVEQRKFTRILVLADTHIMGPVKSVMIDKWRREWQMRQAFSISLRVYDPDVIIFMGDLFDEASFSWDKSFEEACNDFERIFTIDRSSREVVVIPGNHDIGFHDHMLYFPHLIDRFQDRFKATTGAELLSSVKIRSLNVVAINSMSFYNDSCPYCRESRRAVNAISRYLNDQATLQGNKFVHPILLTHIPLYRLNDTQCEYPSHLERIVEKENLQGKDVLHDEISQFLLRKIQPRLIISGHTHMKCKTNHLLAANDRHEFHEEITISSYNHKYAEKKPGFLLLSASRTGTFATHCDLVEEWVIASIYIAAVVLICSRLIILKY